MQLIHNCAFCSDRFIIWVARCEEFHRILSILWCGSLNFIQGSNSNEVASTVSLTAPRTSQCLKTATYISRYTFSVENNASTPYTYTNSKGN